MNIAFLTAAAEGGSMLGTFGTLILILGVFWFMIIRPQKKQEKQAQAMRNSIEVGDEIVTIGGIIGIVVSMKEDSLVLETGSDRGKIRVTRWAVQQNLTVHENEAAAAEAAKKNKKTKKKDIETPVGGEELK